jgi:hypothetical protein
VIAELAKYFLLVKKFVRKEEMGWIRWMRE